ncbi:hypothetical protein H0H87_011243 [Tephrocybe sp. NHM501043]|nr:hypothetical protein H0H87_011243 [Tephrocybe sp. NHM501043]
MAQAQRLSDQVKSLNSRVRELEAALARTGHAVPEEQAVSRNVGDREAPRADGVESVSEAIGSLSLGADGQAKYHGESAGSEYLQDLLLKDETYHARPPTQLNLPSEILNLMHAFPFGFKECPYNKSIFIPYLPHKSRAIELANVYYASVAWMYDPIPFNDFVESIVNPIYGSEGYPSTDALHSHRLAVFFMILANGNLYDESHSDPFTVAEVYYALARAALSLDSILVEVTCATVQALFLVFRFIYNSSQSDKEERWLLTGLATRVAQTIGLRMCLRSGHIPALTLLSDPDQNVIAPLGTSIHKKYKGDDISFGNFLYGRVGRALSMDGREHFSSSIQIADTQKTSIKLGTQPMKVHPDAIREASNDPLKHKYRKSVIAAFQTARRLISVLRSFFSSCVILGALVVESPGCSLANKAMHELEHAIPFFAEGSKLCRPPFVLKFLHSLYQRAFEAYNAFESGQEPIGLSTRPNSDEPDELKVLGGRHNAVITKSNPSSPSQMAASPSTLHQEAANSSPIPRHMSVSTSSGYYSMDTSPHMAQKSHDYQMDDALHRFEDHSYSSIGKGIHDSRSASNSYGVNQVVVGGPGDVHLAHSAGNHPVIGSPNFGVPHDPYPPQTSGNTQQPSPPYLPYVHGHNPAVQSAHPGSGYGYPARPLQEPTAQNQDEIWRSFMMGYGP